jgi:hypothetical protein
MYQQTRLLEKSVNMLDVNQQNITNALSNLNPRNEGNNLRQEIYNDNRRMLLEILAPLNTQIASIKQIYQETKECAREVNQNTENIRKTVMETKGSNDVEHMIQNKYNQYLDKNQQMKGVVSELKDDIKKICDEEGISDLLNMDGYREGIQNIKEQIMVGISLVIILIRIFKKKLKKLNMKCIIDI